MDANHCSYREGLSSAARIQGSVKTLRAGGAERRSWHGPWRLSVSRRLKDLGAWVRDQKPSDMTRYDKCYMDYDYGLLWTIMDYYGLLWTIMDYYGLLWTIMDYGPLNYGL